MKVKKRGTVAGARMESLEPRRMLALTAELLHDTNTFHADAYPNNFTKIGDTAYFFANDAVHGYELWKTDGTSGGTSLVKDIFPGVGSSDARARAGNLRL